MSMLMILKEGGSLLIDTIGNKPIDEDIDLLPETSAGISFALRLSYDGLSVTSVTQTQVRAIVLGDS